MKFSPESVAAFIAVLGILSIIAQVSFFIVRGKDVCRFRDNNSVNIGGID